MTMKKTMVAVLFLLVCLARSAWAEKVTYGGHAYEIGETGLTWTQAKVACEAKGGHLATITSDLEQAWIEDLIKGQGVNTYWAGLSCRQQDGGWVWVTGEASSYEHWSPEQPDLDLDGYMAIRNAADPKVAGSTVGGWYNLNGFGEPSGTYALSNISYLCEWDDPSLIRSRGYVYDLAGGKAAIRAYEGSKTQLEIPASLDGHDVAGIGASAFAGNNTLVSVSLPDTVTWVGPLAFQNCTALQSVTMTEHVASVSDNAFTGCSLWHLTLPGWMAEGTCEYGGMMRRWFIDSWGSVQSIDFVGTGTTVGNDAFYRCSHLLASRCRRASRRSGTAPSTKPW